MVRLVEAVPVYYYEVFINMGNIQKTSTLDLHIPTPE